MVEAENLSEGTPQTGEPAPNAVCKADIVRDDLTGLCLGQYALGRKIGGGGMGKVFAARHLHLDRAFAIKFMSSDLSQSTDAQLRFEQEVRALGQLQHQHIVNAVDAGCVNGVKYLVTELVDGEDLSKLVQRRGALPMAESCELVRQAAVGLAYSHAHGFVHRDIKPSNLIRDRAGTVVILDFGLVRSLEVDGHLTQNGEMLGTWDFIAPEQAHDASQVDFRCDLYSLGCTLVYLLSGAVPFGGDRYLTPAAKLKGHLFDRPPWLDQLPAHIPSELATVLERLLAKSPADRFASAEDVAQALVPFASGAIPAASNRANRRTRAAHWAPPGIVAALGMIIGGNVFFFRESPSEAQAPLNEVHPPTQLLQPPEESESMIDSDDSDEDFASAEQPPLREKPRLKTLPSRSAKNAAVEFNPSLDRPRNRLAPKADGR